MAENIRSLYALLFPPKKGLNSDLTGEMNFLTPNGLLEGTGKISRYIVIKPDTNIKSPAIKKLLLQSLKAYRQKVEIK